MSQMSEKLPSATETMKTFVIPRKEMDFFKIGRLYSLKYNDPWKYKLKYTIFDVKKINEKERTSPKLASYNINYTLQYKMEPAFVSHKSYNLNEVFICIADDVNVLRDFGAVFDGQKVDVSAIRKVPVFLFHEKKTNKQIIGAIQVDINGENLEAMFGDKLHKIQTTPGIIYIENFFEKID